MHTSSPQSAVSHAVLPEAVAAEIAAQFGPTDARAIVFFCSHRHDGAEISRLLHQRYPAAEVIGCTTAGEFTEREASRGSVVALALGAGEVRSAYGSLAELSGGVDAGVRAAAARIEGRRGTALRELDPTRHVGVLLVDGLGMREEDVNHTLGTLAPMLSFVGGSAADDLAFEETRVFYNGESSRSGAALLLLEMAVPFAVTKTCSFEPTQHRLVITRADPAHRVVYEVNGRPVLEAYAEAAGCAPAEVGGEVFMRHPVGLMVGDDPWIRSPQQVTPDGGLKFYCRIEEGMEVNLMRGGDLISETAAAFEAAAERLGGAARGALVFNCVLRRLQLDAEDRHRDFVRVFRRFPTAGFHTYGESWLGHINQTCTALVFA